MRKEKEIRGQWARETKRCLACGSLSLVFSCLHQTNGNKNQSPWHQGGCAVLLLIPFHWTKHPLSPFISLYYSLIFNQKAFALPLLTKSYTYIEFNLSCRNYEFHLSRWWEAGCRIMGPPERPCGSHLANRLIFSAERCKFTYVSGMTAPVKGISLVYVTV